MAQDGLVQLPKIPAECEHNAHMFYVRFKNTAMRAKVMAALKQENILSVFHYIPLHSAPAGQQFGKTTGQLPVTDQVAATILRLPLWIGVQEHQAKIVSILKNQMSARE